MKRFLELLPRIRFRTNVVIQVLAIALAVVAKLGGVDIPDVDDDTVSAIASLIAGVTALKAHHSKPNGEPLEK